MPLLDAATIMAWVQLLTIAEKIGQDVVFLLKDHAQNTMTDETWATLEAAWAEDAARAKRNAGIGDPTGTP